MAPDRPGCLALVGSGEFLPGMRAVDRELLTRAGGRKVAILPTASAPDGPGVPERWAAAGVAHFEGLGAQASAVMALDRAGCHAPTTVDAIRRSNLVYLSGGKPDYLHATLAGTPAWAAVTEVLEAGGVVAGCSAGAMILGGWIPARPSLQRPSLWRRAFDLVPGAVVVPHFDELPAWVVFPAGWLRPRPSFVLGVDGSTALVGWGTAWTVMGRGRVVVRGGAGSMLPPGVYPGGVGLSPVEAPKC